jgi:hypothetical protein
MNDLHVNTDETIASFGEIMSASPAAETQSIGLGGSSGGSGGGCGGCGGGGCSGGNGGSGGSGPSGL